jgi:hypothetical protein
MRCSVLFSVRPSRANSTARSVVEQHILTDLATSGQSFYEIIRAFHEKSEKAYFFVGPADPEELLALPTNYRSRLDITNSVVIGPSATIYPFLGSEEIRAEDALAMQDINKPADFHLGWYFYGAIKYMDVFRNEHITKYCFSIAGWANQPSRPRPFPSFCKHWNCVDDACKADKIAYEMDVQARLRTEEEDRQKTKEIMERTKSLREQMPLQTPSTPQ